MRVGHNPARFVESVAQPAEITVAVVNCIPFLSGYYEQSLEVLKVVVESLNATRESDHPYDVLIFDNHSCSEVRKYLKDANDHGKIQYLVLSETNIGKIGAWNHMFGAAQGKYIVFSDGDIEFRPGWLSASLEIFKTFPNVGMVTARPLPTPKEYSTATYEWALREKVLEEGPFLNGEIVAEHARSLGIKIKQGGSKHPRTVSRVTYEGKVAFIGAAHFQFMALREELQKIVPISSEKPMRGERILDVAINQAGLLRLTTVEPLVSHMGNCPPDSGKMPDSHQQKKKLLNRVLNLSGIRKILLWVNNQIFRLYFFNVD
jgi:Glycosyltransferases, probably involved in cell wall biogenesis